jgi:hypothetical protein
VSKKETPREKAWMDLVKKSGTNRISWLLDPLADKAFLKGYNAGSRAERHKSKVTKEPSTEHARAIEALEEIMRFSIYTVDDMKVTSCRAVEIARDWWNTYRAQVTKEGDEHVS